MKQELTDKQIQLIERWFDGDTTPEEARAATQLVASVEAAREFHEALKEINAATQAAEQAAWDKAPSRPAQDIVLAATQDEAMALSDLAPLLERFFDGECDDFEAEMVVGLIDARPDVADYLEGLEELRGGLKISMDEVHAQRPMDQFWAGVESRLGAGFVAAEHNMLLQRYHDGEVNAEERAQVDAWTDPAVKDGLAALGELHLAANAAIDHACEGVEFAQVWGAVEAAMDADVESKGDNVVSLGRIRREAQGSPRASFGAIAALVAAVLVGGLFSQKLFGPQKVIVEKTVVIVDSVEYAPGASVMIDSPVQQASAISNADSEDVEEPTVIWILDEGDGTLEDDADSVAPVQGAPTEKKPIGQPI